LAGAFVGLRRVVVSPAIGGRWVAAIEAQLQAAAR